MQTLRASKCGLSTTQLPAYILDVIDALTKAGYEAYIVGGGVRDLMLGLNPKDFDAVTNATPSQVKEVFGRRCRIIGRRFELAHVHKWPKLMTGSPPGQKSPVLNKAVRHDSHLAPH